jgi:mono/diheme cytochrome c family protein
MSRKGILIAVAVIAVAAAAWGASKAYALREALYVRLPEYPAPKQTVWLNQNVSKEQLGWFYHADQGTRTLGIPYEWFAALEQPEVSLRILPTIGVAATGGFSDPDYLNRFGFIADTLAPDSKALPIGFARGGAMLQDSGEPWLNPQTRQAMTGIGLTCAACHTGHFTYKGTAVIVDGGPALTDLTKLKQGVGASLFLTRYLPSRFNRFAYRILGPDAAPEAKVALASQLDGVLKQYKETGALEEKVGGTYEGFGRLDALNRIGNQVFALDLKNTANYAAHSAPVHYPRIWDAPWFTWVQYNGSIMQPMVRNAGEALGVSAELNLTDSKRGLFGSSVPVKTLEQIEKMLAGEKVFDGLTSPRWPEDILPPIDQKLAASGAALYKEICQGCHLPPTTSQEFLTHERWLPPNQAGQRLLDVEVVDLKHVGTDPAQAEGMLNRKIAAPANLGLGSDQFGPALGVLVEKTVNAWFDAQTPPVPDADRLRINGNRPNLLQTPRGYKVRPLNGVWATPPYLHNASVPTIDALLSPASERPAKFTLGNREYDPVKLGYRTDDLVNGFVFDTTLPGNSNRGHEFSDEKRDGVIGRKLTPDERKALLEYIKTL